MKKLLLLINLAIIGLPLASVFAVEPELARSPILTWNDLALNTVRAASLIDAQAARTYAMVNVAMYDAVNGIDSVHGPKDKRGSALIQPQGAPQNGNRSAAAAAAAHAVLVALDPARSGTYDAQLNADLAALGQHPHVNSGRAWGASVGQRVVQARTNDGSTPNETQPAGAGPGVFRADWSNVQFRNLRPFGISNSQPYVSAGPPALTSAAYAAALAEVKIQGNAAVPDPDALPTFQFWNSGAGTSQPPGEWIKVAIILAEQRADSLSLSQEVRFFALLGMALSDVVAPTFTTKFNFRFWRPATAIREADTDGNPFTDADPGWTPRTGTNIGTSPEHTSGHSSFAGAGTTILRGFFCDDNMPFTLDTDATQTGARTYESFSQVEAEAGRSRILGGIHFEFSNQAGLQTGRGVANEILATRLLLIRGATHYGQCPL